MSHGPIIHPNKQTKPSPKARRPAKTFVPSPAIRADIQSLKRRESSDEKRIRRIEQLLRTMPNGPKSDTSARQDVAHAAFITASSLTNHIPPPVEIDIGAGVSYVPLKASTATSITLAAGNGTLIVPTPYCGKALAIATSTGGAPVLGPATNGDMNALTWTNGTTTGFAFGWFQSTSPLTMFNSSILQEKYQYMGGYMEVAISTAYNQQVIVNAVGADDAPGFYGRKISAEAVNGYSTTSARQFIFRDIYEGSQTSQITGALGIKPTIVHGNSTKIFHIPIPPCQVGWKTQSVDDSDTTSDCITTQQQLPFGQPYHALRAGLPFIVVRDSAGAGCAITVQMVAHYNIEIDPLNSGLASVARVSEFHAPGKAIAYAGGIAGAGADSVSALRDSISKSAQNAAKFGIDLGGVHDRLMQLADRHMIQPGPATIHQGITKDTLATAAGFGAAAYLNRNAMKTSLMSGLRGLARTATRFGAPVVEAVEDAAPLLLMA